jgi:hypothetical protein
MHKKKISHEHCYMHAAKMRQLLPWSVLEAISHRPSFHTRFLKPFPPFFFLFFFLKKKEKKEKEAACLVYARMYARIAPHCGRNHNAEKTPSSAASLPQRLRPRIIFRHWMV